MTEFITTRRKLLLSTAAIAVAPAIFASLVRADDNSLERIKTQGFIRIGFADEVPFSYATPDGKLTGEAIEVAKTILAKMGINRIDGVLTEFSSLIPGLTDSRFDIIAAGLFINPKRCAEIALSEPSFGIGQAMLVKTGNPKGIKDYASIKDNKDLKLAVMAGAAEVGYAKEAGIGDDQLVLLPNQSSLVMAVQSGRADAAALTALSIADMAKKSDGVESTAPFDEVNAKSVKGHGGFGFRKEDKSLYEAFNKELTAFIGTPEHISLVSPFGFGADYLPNKTMEQLCKGE